VLISVLQLIGGLVFLLLKFSKQSDIHSLHYLRQTHTQKIKVSPSYIWNTHTH